jgi:hypothetical protein
MLIVADTDVEDVCRLFKRLAERCFWKHKYSVGAFYVNLKYAVLKWCDIKKVKGSLYAQNMN